jgi:hypothetical protein
MAEKSFAETIDERLAAIERIVALLTEDGGQADLRDLRLLLIDVIGLLKRDPGVEAAVDDLYAAARCLVVDRGVGSQPQARKLRLLRDARQRFHDRLIAASEKLGPEEYRELQGAAAVYAAHMSPRVVSVDLGWYRKLSA